MICKNCGKEIKEGSAFCPECGAKAESNASAQANQIDVGAFQSAMTNSGETVAVKKKSKKKWLVIGIIVLVIIVIACAVGGSNENNKGTSGNSVIVENDDCQLGATYDMTPEQYIKRYNAALTELGGDSSLYMPSIDSWTAADLLEDGNTTYTYCVSKELIYWIYTYQDDKVTLATCTLGDSLIGYGCLYMAIMECAALNINDKDTVDSMYELFSEKIQNGYGVYCYRNSIVTVDGNDIRIGAVSDEVLNTMEYYSVSDSELQ